MPFNLHPLYQTSPEIDENSFSNIEWDEFSRELIQKGQALTKKTGVTQKYAVVGMIARGEQKEAKPTLRLFVRPGFGPPTPSAKEIKLAEETFGKGNFVIAQKALGSGIVHRETIDQAERKDPTVSKKYMAVVGLSFSINKEDVIEWKNRSSLNYHTFKKDPLALACYDFLDTAPIEFCNEMPHTYSYDLDRSIPEKAFTEIAENSPLPSLKPLIVQKTCFSMVFEEKWNAIREIPKEEDQKRRIGDLLMRNIYIYSSLDKKKENISKDAGSRIKKILHEAKKNGISLNINAVPPDLSAETAKATALILAADKGHLDVVKILLDEKAHLDLKDGRGRTAIVTAILKGKWEIVKLLLEHGDKLEKPAVAFFHALRQQNDDGLILLISHCLKCGDSRNKDEFLYCLAHEKSYSAIAKILIDYPDERKNFDPIIINEVLTYLIQKSDYVALGKLFEKNVVLSLPPLLVKKIEQNILEKSRFDITSDLVALKALLPTELFKKIFESSNIQEKLLQTFVAVISHYTDKAFAKDFIDQMISLSDSKPTPSQIQGFYFFSNLMQGHAADAEKQLKNYPDIDFSGIHPFYNMSVKHCLHQGLQNSLPEKNLALKILTILKPHPGLQEILNDRFDAEPLLITATKLGENEVVEMLVKLGAKKNITDSNMQTPFQIAMANNKNDLAILFLADSKKPLAQALREQKSLDMPTLFSQLKPYECKYFKHGTEETRNLYEENSHNRQIQSIISILGEQIAEIKDISSSFMKILEKRKVTPEIEKELQLLGFKPDQIKAIDIKIKIFSIENQISRISQENIISLPESPNVKQTIQDAYTLILRRAIATHSKQSDILQQGLSDLSKLDLAELKPEKIPHEIEKIITNVTEKIRKNFLFSAQARRSTSLSSLNKLLKQLKQIDPTEIKVWSAYEKQLDKSNLEIRTLKEAVVALKSEEKTFDSKPLASSKDRITSNRSTLFKSRDSDERVKNVPPAPDAKIMNRPK